MVAHLVPILFVCLAATVQCVDKLTLADLLAASDSQVDRKVVELSFRLADVDNDKQLDAKEARQATLIGMQLSQAKGGEISDGDKKEDRLIDVPDSEKLLEHPERITESEVNRLRSNLQLLSEVENGNEAPTNAPIPLLADSLTLEEMKP
uniref:EF-hand domain-containing protein n=2 Tax=Steinernema glaseri TaxID=37863 RepID=A0A1I7YIR0_9BILA